MSDEIDDALLHERLQAGAFEVTPTTDESTAQLRDMIARAEQEARVRPRRVGLIVCGSLVAAVLLGGATILPAVIDVFRQSSSVQLPLFDYEYTLPSGTRCDATYGVYADADSEAVETIRRDTTVARLIDGADIDAAIADLRADPNTYVSESGAEEPGGYGTRHYDADTEYELAVRQAIRDGVQVELVRGGFSADALGVNSWGESSCPAAAW